jgi:molybdate transport system substrate-binding protein
MMATRRNLVIGLVAGIAGLTTSFLAPSASLRAQETLTVFAAASLKNALDDVNSGWQAEGAAPAVISYAASSALAKQIGEGAPADVFVSADLDWMKYLADRSLTKKDTQVQLLGNRIVLIAPKGSTLSAKIAPGFPLADLLGDGKLAMADVKPVPAGKYGKAALEALGVWSSVKGKIAQSENVRAALKLVSAGEAPLGIVYQTDAAADPNVKILDMFPEDSHPPIVYPAAVVASSKNPDAEKLLKYLQSARAKKLFEKHGFTVLAPKVTN